MRDQVGIEIKLKEDLTARLKTWVHLFEQIQKHTKLLAQSQGLKKTNDQLDQMNRHTKNVNDRLDQMNRHIKNINAASAGLGQTSRHLKNMGGAAQSATRQVKGLELGLGAVAKVLGPLMLGYKALQGLMAGATEGLDFQSQLVGLSRTNMTAANQIALKNQAITIGGSGKSILSAGQIIETGKDIIPIIGENNVKGAIPDIVKFANAMRQSNKTFDKPSILPRFWELFGRRSPEERDKLDEQLLKTVQGGGITLEQLITQLNIEGGSLLGQDPPKALRRAAFFIKESGAGFGGGGRGRAGAIGQALDRMITQGKIPKGTMDLWQSIPGLLPGAEKYQKTTKSGRHVPLVDQNGHQVIMTSGNVMGAGSSNIDYKKYMLSKDFEKSPLAVGAGDQDALALNLAVAVGRGKEGLKGTFDEVLKQFQALPDVIQKRDLALITGGTNLATQGIVQTAAGRYFKSRQVFDTAIDQAPGFGDGQAISVEQKFEEFTAQWKTFAAAFVNTPELMNKINNTMDGLINTMSELNQNVKPIAEFVSKLLPGSSEGAKSGLGGALGGAVAGGALGGPWGALGGAIAGGLGASKIADQIKQAQTHGPGKFLWRAQEAMKDPTRRAAAKVIIDTALSAGMGPEGAIAMLATGMWESGLDAKAVGDHGTSFGLFQNHKGGALGSHSPAWAMDAVNNAQNAAARFKAYVGHGFQSVGDLAKAVQRPGAPNYISGVNAMVPAAKALYAEIHLDGPATTKLLKGEAVKVNQAAQKKQAKSLNQMSQTGSKAGGSMTTNAHNHGDSGD